MSVTTVLLADDHPIVRQGMRHLLEKYPDFKIIGEAGDGAEAIRLLNLLKPDVLIIDIIMPGLNGLEVLRQFKKMSPATKAIVFSMHSTDAYVSQALNLGADGYVLKETGPRELASAIKEVIRGNQFLSEKLLKRPKMDRQIAEYSSMDMYQTLTTREREILQMTAAGMSSAEMGKKLIISPRTVELHRSRFMKKLGLRNQTELVRYAIRRGILLVDE